jgi:DNA-binding CsgD family transcriptional regulator
MEIDNPNSCLTPAMPAADRAATFCDVLQLLGTAAVLVDSGGRIVGLNDAARDCVGAGLHIRNRRLITDDPLANRALKELIDGIRDGCKPNACADEQVVVARRTTRPLILRTIRLDARAASLFHPARAIILVLDAGRVSLPIVSQLDSAFGLSCGEARLAVRLAAGQSLASAASLCGIAYETARKRLKVVFEKTDTRRQSELVALIIRVGALAGAAQVVCGQTMRPRPRHSIIDDYSPASRLQQTQATSRNTRWKQLSTA